MKTYTLSGADSLTHEPEKPELTARRTAPDGFSMTYQVWTNRKALAKTVRMQQKRALHHSDWLPIVRLTDGEGF